MNYNIRPYSFSDFEMVYSWWTSAKECPPILGMMINDGSFILELNGVPALSLTVFLTQSKEISFIEGFIKNPEFRNTNLEEYGKILWNHCFNYAKDSGYNRIICYCLENKLIDKYKRFGMEQSASNLTSFVRIL